LHKFIGIGTGGARGAMAPTEFLKYILAPPLLPAFTKLIITYAINASALVRRLISN